jgi:hypothetical protein
MRESRGPPAAESGLHDSMASMESVFGSVFNVRMRGMKRQEPEKRGLRVYFFVPPSAEPAGFGFFCILGWLYWYLVITFSYLHLPKPLFVYFLTSPVLGWVVSF